MAQADESSIAGITSPSLFAATPVIDSLRLVLDRYGTADLAAERRHRLMQAQTVDQMIVSSIASSLIVRTSAPGTRSPNMRALRSYPRPATPQPQYCSYGSCASKLSISPVKVLRSLMKSAACSLYYLSRSSSRRQKACQSSIRSSLSSYSCCERRHSPRSASTRTASRRCTSWCVGQRPSLTRTVRSGEARGVADRRRALAAASCRRCGGHRLSPRPYARVSTCAVSARLTTGQRRNEVS